MRDRRYRGRVPADIRARLERVTRDFVDRYMPAIVAQAMEDLKLKGLSPGLLTEDELEQLSQALDCTREDLARWLGLLAEIGYGARSERKPRRRREHGSRREDRIHQVRGLLGRSVALRLPTTADTRRAAGPNDGYDRWGPVRCSHTLRPLHLGVLAAVGGLWQRHAEGGHVECSRGEIASMVLGTTRPSGRDLSSIANALSDLAALSLSASVDEDGMNGRDGLRPMEHPLAIPSSPVAMVQFRLDDRWLSPYDYAAAIAAGESPHVGKPEGGTVRIYLRPWYLEQLRDVVPVLINFDVWTYHRPAGRRLYAFLQAHGRRREDDNLHFYLGQPQLYTFGLQRTPRHRARRMIEHDLLAHYYADERCKGYGPGVFGRGRIPAFVVKLKRGRASHPRPLALAARAPAKRRATERVTARSRRARLAENVRRQDVINQETGERRSAAQIQEILFTRKAIGQGHLRAHRAHIERGSPIPPQRYDSLGDP